MDASSTATSTHLLETKQTWRDKGERERVVEEGGSGGGPRGKRRSRRKRERGKEEPSARSRRKREREKD